MKMFRVRKKVFDLFWYWVYERQNIFFNRFEGEMLFPWTKDKIFQTFRFTNAYRASDRVSQYLINNVIYNGANYSKRDVIFRILLFKIFNKIETWEELYLQFGSLKYRDFDFKYAIKYLTKLRKKQPIFNSAYIMNGLKLYGHNEKHGNYLLLLKQMFEHGIDKKIVKAKSLGDVFELLVQYPCIGNFLAYQFTIDINYSNVINFNENDFVMPGIGAVRGIKKAFLDFGDYSYEDVIKWMVDHQQDEFKKRGYKFKDLWGRPLHAIDIQNIFCEIDKYSREKFPELTQMVYSNKKKNRRIKKRFEPNFEKIDYFYPPKWKLSGCCFIK